MRLICAFALAVVFAHAAVATEAVVKSASTHPLVFFMVDNADHITGKTGLSPTVTLSKAGGSFASPSGAVSEIGNGWYKVAGNSTDTNTLGALILHASASGADPADVRFCVVVYNDQDPMSLGLAVLPSASPGNTGGFITLGTGAGQISLTSGQVNAVGQVNGNVTGDVDGSVGGIATGGISATSFGAGAIDAAAIAADAIGASEIAADAIGSSEVASAAVTEIQSGLSTYAGGDTSGTTTLLSRLSATRAGYLDNLSGGAVALASGVTVTTNNDKTGYGLATGAITATVIATDAIGSDEIAATAVTEIQSGLSTLTSAQVNTECDTALSDVGLTSTITGRIDAAISSRLASASYTAPLDAAGVRTAVGLASANLDTQLGAIDDYVDSEVAAIKTVTDNLATAIELDGSVYRFTTNALEQAPTGGGGSEASIADAVWDELLADHVISGSAGAGLAAAQSAGDPWSTLLPGSYTTGTAGLQLATVYSRLGSMRLTVQNPVASDGTLTIVQGDDYSSTSSLSISRTWPGSNLTGGTMVFSAMTTAQYQAGTGTAALDSIACTFTGGTSGSTVVVTIPLTAAQTAGLSPSPADDPLNYVYHIRCTTTGGKVHTLFLGSMTVKRSVE